MTHFEHSVQNNPCRSFQNLSGHSSKYNIVVNKAPNQFINILSFQYCKFHCGDKTILRPPYLHNHISYTGNATFLYWLRDQKTTYDYRVYEKWTHCNVINNISLPINSWENTGSIRIGFYSNINFMITVRDIKEENVRNRGLNRSHN